MLQCRLRWNDSSSNVFTPCRAAMSLERPMFLPPAARQCLWNAMIFLLHVMCGKSKSGQCPGLRNHPLKNSVTIPGFGLYVPFAWRLCASCATILSKSCCVLSWPSMVLEEQVANFSMGHRLVQKNFGAFASVFWSKLDRFFVNRSPNHRRIFPRGIF